MARNINDYSHLLWVHKQDPAFDGETGFVPCTADEFSTYRISDIAQDPAVGAHHLRDIDTTYETKVMTPRRGRKPKVKAQDADEADTAE